MPQEELPAQDKMKIGGHRGFMPYMAVAQGIAAALSGPGKTAVRHPLLLQPHPPSLILHVVMMLCVPAVTTQSSDQKSHCMLSLLSQELHTHLTSEQCDCSF